MPRGGRIGTAVVALALAAAGATDVTGCSAHHGGSTPTSTAPGSTIAPTVAPTGADGARQLATQAGCTGYDPLPVNATLQRIGAVSAGTCALGSDQVLFATVANSSVIPRALSAAAQLGAIAGVSVYAAVGPNWVAAGSSSPTKALAAKLVAKLGGRVEQATAPSPSGGSGGSTGSSGAGSP